jgi:molybdopterin-binding protein
MTIVRIFLDPNGFSGWPRRARRSRPANPALLSRVPNSVNMEVLMRVSARNQLTGTVASIEVGAVMTIVRIDLDGGQRVTSSVTRQAVEELGLTVGTPVTAMVKSTEVMLGVE